MNSEHNDAEKLACAGDFLPMGCRNALQQIRVNRSRSRSPSLVPNEALTITDLQRELAAQEQIIQQQDRRLCDLEYRFRLQSVSIDAPSIVEQLIELKREVDDLKFQQVREKQATGNSHNDMTNPTLTEQAGIQHKDVTDEGREPDAASSSETCDAGVVTAQSDEGAAVSQKKKTMASLMAALPLSAALPLPSVLPTPPELAIPSALPNMSKLSDKLQTEYLSIQPSSWEIVAFMGSAGFGKVGSIVLVIVVVLNALVQTMFCFIAHISLTDDDFNEDARSEYEAWRVSAHEFDFVDPIRGETLVQRVCDLDGSLSIGTNQLLVRETIQRYTERSIFTGGSTAGETMCMLALLIWYLSVGGELNAMYDHVSAVLHIPTGPFQIVDAEDDMSDAMFKIESLDIWRKSLCYVTTIARFVIAGYLACVGTLVIVSTNSVGDLLLNAFALEMVLHVDEYLFNCMVPTHSQKFVNLLSPVRMNLRRWHGLTFQIFTGFGLVPISMMLVFHTMLTPHVNDLLEAEKLLCSGNLKFTYTVDVGGFGHAAEDVSLDFSGIAGDEMIEITSDAVKLAAWSGVSPDSPQNMLLWQRDVSNLDFIRGVRNVSELDDMLQYKCKDLLASHDCSVPVLSVRGECPAGYMDPRDAAECRSAAIAIGFWNESKQQQQTRAHVEADIEVDSAARQCVFLEDEHRTVWYDGGVAAELISGSTGPCLCEPKTAATYQRFATIVHGVPVKDCEQLLQMGACTLENPWNSGSWENSSVTRWLCPETCGCSLLPRSPLRTRLCPESCRVRQSWMPPDRECTDIAADEFQQTMQMQFFVADLRSTRFFGAHTSWKEPFLEDLEFRGCNFIQALKNPYGDHSVNIAPPCPGSDEQRLGCLALRCQDFDSEYCNTHIQQDKLGPYGLPEGCTSNVSIGDSVLDLSLLCRRTCQTCFEMDFCRDLNELVQEEALPEQLQMIFPNEDLWPGLALARFSRFHCPKVCECDDGGNGAKAGCPKSCIDDKVEQRT